MEGRPRRSVGRLQRAKYRKEGLVLRPASPDAELPEFVLEEAAVYKKDGVTLANPLEVSLKGPFVIRGKLVIDTDEAAARLVTPGVKVAYIEVSECSSYSIGVGPAPTLWILAEAGWMDVRPSPQFRNIYDKVLEAITLYYEIMDAYTEIAGYKYGEKLKKRQRHIMLNAPLDEVFFRYAVGAGDAVLRSEVEHRCDDHALFLLDHFPKATELDWPATSFYHWIHGRHRDLQAKLDKAAAQQKAKVEALQAVQARDARTIEVTEADKRQRAEDLRQDRMEVEGRGEVDEGEEEDGDDEDEEVEGEDGQDESEGDEEEEDPIRPMATQRRSTRETGDMSMHDAPPSSRELPVRSGPILAPQRPPPAAAPVGTPPVTTDPSSDSVLSSLIELLNEIAAENGGPEKCSHKTLRGKMYFMCKIINYETPLLMFRWFAPDLLRDLDTRWQRGPFCAWLRGKAKDGFTPEELALVKPAEFPARLLRRAKKADILANAAQSQIEREHRRQSGTPTTAAGPRAPDPRRQYAGKAAGLRLAGGTTARKRPHNELGDDDDEDEDYEVHGYGGGAEGPASSSSSRHRAQQQQQPPPSHSRMSTDVDDDDDESDDDSEEEDDTNQGGGAGKVVLRSYPLQSDKPTGPRGMWTCAAEGCGFVVRSANEEPQREKVWGHIRSHGTAGTSTLLAQAQDEGRRHGVSIQNLLDRIMSEADKKKPSKRQVPEGVKRVNLGW